jgi:very-short-patch-repair endonuclease
LESNIEENNNKTPSLNREGGDGSPFGSPFGSPSWHTASPDRYALLKSFARENRKNMTDGESALWNALSNQQLNAKFLRQYIIGDYIVDFFCRKNNLIIEVDGGYHSEPRQQEDDEMRSQWLIDHGYHVIRFSNEEILFNTNQVIETIKNHL